MYPWKVLASVLGLSLVLGTGVLAEILEGEPGTSPNPKDNVPEKIQRDEPYLKGDDLPGDSGPGSRGGALTGLKHEKPVQEGLTELEENVQKTHAGAAALAAEELKLKSMEKSKEGIFSRRSGNP